ncbi:MAG: hypothetical protein KFF77_06870 [Bacteroidetes bacterium]|nr:hypothetical protein [Bacteroidota bacterium]
MNRNQLETKLSNVTNSLLRDKGYICFPDVFMSLGVLDAKDVDAWRARRVPALERVVKMNLSRISFVMKKVRSNSLNGGLKPRRTAYMSWGKGPKQRLRFSKSGTPSIEDLWATHFVGNNFQYNNTGERS